MSAALRWTSSTVVAAMNVGVQVERATVEKMRREFLPRLLEEAKDLQPQLI